MEREAVVQRVAQGGASSAGKEGVCMAGAARQTPHRQHMDSKQLTCRHYGQGADGGAVARGCGIGKSVRDKGSEKAKGGLT